MQKKKSYFVCRMDLQIGLDTLLYFLFLSPNWDFYNHIVIWSGCSFQNKETTLTGLIFVWRNVRDFREFDLFHENKTRKNKQNPSKMHQNALKTQKKSNNVQKHENKTREKLPFFTLAKISLAEISPLKVIQLFPIMNIGNLDIRKK